MKNTTTKLYKISARRDLDISCVNMAVTMEVTEGKITVFRLAYGGVGPVVKRMYDIENFDRKGCESNHNTKCHRKNTRCDNSHLRCEGA